MSLLTHDGLRTFFSGRRRFQLAWLFAFFLIFSAKQYPSLLGVLICFLGASLRFTASGFLRKESKLAVGGPYSHTRNPLYLGTFFMALGATLSVGAFFLTLAIGVVFFFNYHYVIEHEEQKLPSYFGTSYLDYCRLVPRFWPRFSTPPMDQLKQINADPEVFTFSMPLAQKNRAFEAYISFVGIILGMMILVFAKSKMGMLH